MPPNRIIAITNEERSVTAETAILLEAYFKVSAMFWLNLQRTYDLKIASRDKIVKAKALKIVVRRKTGIVIQSLHAPQSAAVPIAAQAPRKSQSKPRNQRLPTT